LANKEELKKIQAEMSAGASQGIPFGHFQLFYESIERVTDRRLALNRNNASLAALIAGGLGVIAAWAHDNVEVRPIALALIFFLAVLAALFCRWWWRQIEDYKALNGSKFEVLAQMAKNVIVPEGSTRCAFDPFFWEWRIASANKDLTGWNGRLALGSSLSEVIVPQAFLAFFVIAASAVAVMLATQFLPGMLPQ